MSEDLRKTTLLPRFANRMAYNTVVMDRPPEMTEALSLAGPDAKSTQQICRRSPAPPMPPPLPLPVCEGLGSSPAATHIPPASGGNVTPIGALRTRMVNVKAMPTFHKPLGSATAPSAPHRLPPPPPPVATLHVAPLGHTPKRKQVLRKAIVVGGAAILLGVFLVVPMGSSAKNAEAEPQELVTTSSALTEPASEVDPGVNPGTASAETASKRLETPVTEEDAGRMLLAGRREEALAMYRKLASSSKSTPGIEAMLEVLTQKVTTP